MAFFGLAHVGPQSSFLANRKNAFTCALFKLGEFEAAFKAVSYAEHSTCLSLSALGRVLDAVFHGPPPPLELARLDAAMLAEAAAAGTAGLTLEQFLEVIEKLQGQPLEVNTDDYAHYTSFDLLYVGLPLAQLAPLLRSSLSSSLSPPLTSRCTIAPAHTLSPLIAAHTSSAR